MKNKSKLSGVKEIARRANVSIATVDRVIHNRTGVSPQTKSKIEAIIKELNYQPNILASRLASGKIIHLAVLIPKGSKETNFWEAPLQGIKRAEGEIRQYGVQIVPYFFDLNSKTSFLKQTEALKKEKLDGILLSPSFGEDSVEFLDYCRSEGIPFVFIDSNIENQRSLSYIGPPLSQSGFLGGRLCSLGFRKSNKLLLLNIAKDSGNTSYVKIEEGFRAYFSRHQIPNEILKLNINLPDNDSVFQHLRDVFKRNADIESIFVTNSRVFSVAKFLEKEIQGKIHLTGYDFIKENRHFLKKGVIDFLICHKPEEQGYKGIMSLYHHLGLHLPVEKVYYMPIDIVTRENEEFYR